MRRILYQNAWITINVESKTNSHSSPHFKLVLVAGSEIEMKKRFEKPGPGLQTNFQHLKSFPWLGKSATLYSARGRPWRIGVWTKRKVAVALRPNSPPPVKLTPRSSTLRSESALMKLASETETTSGADVAPLEIVTELWYESDSSFEGALEPGVKYRTFTSTDRSPTDPPVRFSFNSRRRGLFFCDKKSQKQSINIQT